MLQMAASSGVAKGARLRLAFEVGAEDLLEEAEPSFGVVLPGLPVDDGAAGDVDAGREFFLCPAESLAACGDAGADVFLGHWPIFVTQHNCSQLCLM